MSDFGDILDGFFGSPKDPLTRAREVNEAAAKKRAEVEKTARSSTPLPQMRGKTIDGVKYLRAEDVAHALAETQSAARVRVHIEKWDAAMTDTDGSEAALPARPWLCRIGLHTSRFGDGSACHRALRCNKCLAWIEPEQGADVDNCRRLMSEDRHPKRACFLPYDDAQRAASGTTDA